MIEWGRGECETGEMMCYASGGTWMILYSRSADTSVGCSVRLDFFLSERVLGRSKRDPCPPSNGEIRSSALVCRGPSGNAQVSAGNVSPAPLEVPRVEKDAFCLT